MDYGIYIIISLVIVFIFIFIYVYLQTFTDFFQKKEPIKYPSPAFESINFTVSNTSIPNPSGPLYAITISTTDIPTNKGDVYLLIYTQGYSINNITPFSNLKRNYILPLIEILPWLDKTKPDPNLINSREMLIFDNSIFNSTGTTTITFQSGVYPVPSEDYKVFAEFLVAPSDAQINTYLQNS